MRKKILYISAAVLSILIIIYLLAGVRLASMKEDKGKAEAKYVSDQEKKAFISVDALCQHPELPTGCESVAAVMVLGFYGDNVSAVEFAENWLSKNSSFYTYEGQKFGPDPNYSFAGA